MRKKTYDYTIGELIEMGADIDVHFHDNKNLQEAYNKVKPFTDISSIQRKEYDGSVWVAISNDEPEHENGVSIASFL